MTRFQISLSFLSLGLALGACTGAPKKHRLPATSGKERSAARPASRSVAGIERIPLSGRRFAFADRNGIAYTLERVNLHLNDTADESNFTLNIEFPSLTADQYRKLMDHFGGQNLVPWRAGRPYNLIDFLPPKIQAFVNRTLEQNYIETPIPPSWRNPLRPEEQEYETGMSCWDAAYEVARDLRAPFRAGASEARVFHIGAPLVDFVLKGGTHGKPQTLSRTGVLPGEAGASERNRGRAVGDVFLLDTFANMGLGAAHAMVWIDDEIYFEKPDMGTNDPFRLVFYEDGVRWFLNEDVLSDENADSLQGNFYRFERGLPDPRSFTGRAFLYDWPRGALMEGEPAPTEPLPRRLAEKFIWNTDVGLGGGLSKFRINPVLSSKMTIGADGRASLKEDDRDIRLHRLF